MSSMHELPPPVADLAPAPRRAARPLLRAVPDVPLDFDDAVRRLTPRLTRYAARRLGDLHEAQELVQEALLRAYKNRAELLTEDDLSAWSTVVVGRLVIDRLRVRGRSFNVADVPEGTRVGRDTADVVVARDEARIALDALDAMPARQAAVLWAREVEGQGYDQIGRQFGMTEPAVRSILTRARKALRVEYAQRGGTLPVAGLSVIAPWVVGLRWADRLRSAAGRLAAPAALGALGLGMVGGALVSPLTQPTPAGPRTTPAVVEQSVVTPVSQGLTAPKTAAAAAQRPDTAVAPATTRTARTPTIAQDSPISSTCISHAGAGAGGGGCAVGTDPAGRLYVDQTLPDNPTGVRQLGVESDRLDCDALPAIPGTTCTTSTRSGGS